MPRSESKMKWLTSTPVIFLNFTASLFTIAGAIGGGFVGYDYKGNDWGKPLASLVGGFTGMGIV